jgi:trans-aconitate methyltransferase
MWKPVYDTVAKLIPYNYTGPICDIGCGTGRLAKALKKSQLDGYIGLDFSKERIKEARRYLPETEFHVMDAYSKDAVALYQRHHFFVLTEILEHLNDDLGLLALLPSGSQIIGSVPNFDNPAHVRSFENPESVFDRFKSLVSFDPTSIRTLTKQTSKNETYVFSGVKT